MMSVHRPLLIFTSTTSMYCLYADNIRRYCLLVMDSFFASLRAICFVWSDDAFSEGSHFAHRLIEIPFSLLTLSSCSCCWISLTASSASGVSIKSTTISHREYSGINGSKTFPISMWLCAR